MALKLPIFMDNHSTTRVDPRVFEAMTPYFLDDFGNAASRTHAYGWKAEAAIESSRDTIARFIGAETGKEIVFTSGATESNNLAIKGVAEYYGQKGKHVITTAIEHKAVLDSCKRLEKEGFSVTYLPVGTDGIVDPAAVEQAMRPDTILVSVMLANNEVGTVQPLEQIGALTRAKGVLFHTDAVQGIGKTPFDVKKMNVDLASLTAHKLYGPKGIGALYVRRSRPRVRLVAQMDGGGHERGNRSGTLNVPGAVGFAKAIELFEREGAADNERILGLRRRLYDGLRHRLERVDLNGDWERRLPGNLNVSFAFVEGEAMMMAIKDVAVSSGSACTSASLEPSYVLRAMGLDEDLAHSSIRFGIGRFNTEEEIDFVVDLVATQVERLRAMSPLYEMYQEGIDIKSIQWSAH